MTTSKNQTNTSFENQIIDPFLSNSILLDDKNDPDINFFNLNDMKTNNLRSRDQQKKN